MHPNLLSCASRFPDPGYDEQAGSSRGILLPAFLTVNCFCDSIVNKLYMSYIA